MPTATFTEENTCSQCIKKLKCCKDYKASSLTSLKLMIWNTFQWMKRSVSALTMS